MALITSGSRKAAAVPARSSQSSSLSMLPETSVASTSFRSTASAAKAAEQPLKQSPIAPAMKAKARARPGGTIVMDCNLGIESRAFVLCSSNAIIPVAREVGMSGQIGELMKLRAICTLACCFLGSSLVLSGIAAAQQRAGGEFPQPTSEKQVTVSEIPGVIAGGAQWKLVWQGPDNADGLVGTKDGGVLFAQEQPSTVGRLDPNDKFSIFATETHGTGALG